MLSFHFVWAQNTEKVALKNTSLSFSLNGEGAPLYEVSFNNRPVILPSGLGFALSEDPLFYKGFQIIGTERRSFDETWQPVWGETRNIRDHYEQLTVQLQKTRPPHRLLRIVFRVFEDGVGFRYEFPNQPDFTDQGVRRRTVARTQLLGRSTAALFSKR